MDSLAGYVATVCVSVAATYLSQFLRPKGKNYSTGYRTICIYAIPANQLL